MIEKWFYLSIELSFFGNRRSYESGDCVDKLNNAYYIYIDNSFCEISISISF